VIPLTRTLARRRHALIARSRDQRADLMFAAQPVVRGLAMVDRVAGLGRTRPFLVTIAVAALVVFGPRKLMFWGLRVTSLITLLRKH
jgi:hypothetical protein